MSVFRAFIAIDLSPDVLSQILAISETLQQKLPGIPVRWVQVGHMHLTLKFLGDVSLANVNVIQDLMRAAVEAAPQFEISVGRLGAFPTQRSPRVLWVGVEAPPPLLALQHVLDTEIIRLGYPADEKPFTPHLTLGRVARHATHRDVHRISEVLGAERVGFLGATLVRQVHLYQSDLQPGGAVYTKMFSVDLQTAGQ